MRRNPFSRLPITKLASLTGRSREVNDLTYCFEQTASGQSQHCAVIGPRGVGKTSLIQCSQELAIQKSLLPVYTSMTSELTKSSYQFWKNLYINICSMAARKGCWGGVDGKQYNSLASSFRKPTSRCVLELPRYWNENDVCADSIIAQDFATIYSELRQRSLSGLVLLIDEADYLTVDVSFLQALRNVFQGVEGVSVVLAGTTTLFSSVTEIFSPVPRQFHKVEIDVFPHWSETHSLIKSALEKAGPEANIFEPEVGTVIELHKATGGDPAEIQLYCHYMWKESEAQMTRMELTHKVYGAVFQDYRRSTPHDAKQTIQHLEALSKNMIPDCPWLQNAALDCKENIDFCVAKKEIGLGIRLDSNEIASITKDVEDSYQTLYLQNISSEPRILKVNDAACIKGMWKSLVRFESGEPWEWREESLGELIIAEAQNILAQKTAASKSEKMTNYSDPFGKYVEAIRDSNSAAKKNLKSVFSVFLEYLKHNSNAKPTEEIYKAILISHQVFETISTLLTATVRQKKNVLRIPVTFQLGERELAHALTFYDSADPNDELGQVRQFMDERSSIFQTLGIQVAIGKPELHMVPQIQEIRLFLRDLKLHFYIDPGQETLNAFDSFAQGRVDEAASILEGIVNLVPDPPSLNNLAFCYMHLKKYKEARTLLDQADKIAVFPLQTYNRAVLEFLEGSTRRCKEILEDLWGKQDSEYINSKIVNFMNVIDSPKERTLLVQQDVPIIVALAHSLVALGVLKKQETLDKLSVFPDLTELFDRYPLK